MGTQVDAAPAKRKAKRAAPPMLRGLKRGYKRSQGHCSRKVSNCVTCDFDNDRLTNKCKYIYEKVPKKDRKCGCDQYGLCPPQELLGRATTYVNGVKCE